MNPQMVMLPIRANHFIQIDPHTMINVEYIVRVTGEPKGITIEMHDGTVHEVDKSLITEVQEICKTFRLIMTRPTDLVVANKLTN